MKNSNKKGKLESDRISALPDVVLHHILSCLDIKEVVLTSLLSSRWRYMWVSLPVIKCNHLLWDQSNLINHNTRFMDFVDKVLLLRDGSNIKKFQLCASDHCDSERIGVWITSALRKHLQEMHLQLCPKKEIELPPPLFSSGITVLELNLASTGKNVVYTKIPNLICSMTRLTTLILISVKLPEGNSSGELLFSYPVLENLMLIECGHEHLKVFNISTPRLKNLVIRNDLDTKTEIEGTCHIELCAPHLQSLEASFKNYENIGFENFRMRNLSSLVSAKFCFCAVDLESMIKFFDVIPSAKTIDLSCNNLHGDLDHELTRPTPNLRCLKFTTAELEPSWIILMLKKFPYIETLVLHMESDCTQLGDMFAGVSYHLKYLEFGLLIGDEVDYECLESLVKNAPVLEKLVIRMDKEQSSSEKETFGEKIFSLFRASSRVSIFYYS